MKIFRYVAGAFGFLLVGFIVAAKVSSIMIHFFPMTSGETSWNWRILPGILLGLIGGIQTFRLAIRVPQEKAPNQWFTWVLAAAGLGLLIFVGWYLYKYL